MTDSKDAYAYERSVIARNLADMSPNNRATVTAWFRDQEQRGRKPSTLDGYAVDLAKLDRFLNAAPLTELDAPRARAFLDSLVPRGQTAVLHAATRIKCFLRDHLETALPLSLLRALRVNCKGGLRGQRPITRDEFIALLAASEGSLRDQALVSILWDSSWRAGEVACLRLRDVEWDTHGNATIRTPPGQDHLKRGDQTAYLTEPVTLKLLHAWMDAHPNHEDPDAPLWPSRKGGPTKNWGVYHVIKRLKRDAEIPTRITPHSFRHGWVTRSLRKKLDPMLIMKQTGWRDLRQLKIYAHMDRQDLERELRRLQGLDEFGQPIPPAVVAMDPELIGLLKALKRGLEKV